MSESSQSLRKLRRHRDVVWLIVVGQPDYRSHQNHHATTVEVDMNILPKSPPIVTMPEFYCTRFFPNPAIRLPSFGWLIHETTITPELAREMLKRVPNTQRLLRLRHVARLANDIRNGFWKLTHQGIAFDTNGFLVDGQHRVNAVVESGMPICCLVFFGVGGPQEMAVYDNGAPRSANDAGKTLGKNMDSNHSAIVRQLFQKNGRTQLSHSEIINLFDLHEKAICFAASIARKFKTGVESGIAAAWYHVEDEKLTRFIQLVDQEIPATELGDRAAITLNKYLNDTSKMATKGRDTRHDTMLKTQRAIQAYIAGENLTLLKTPLQPIYQVPVDGQRLFETT